MTWLLQWLFGLGRKTEAHGQQHHDADDEDEDEDEEEEWDLSLS